MNLDFKVLKNIAFLFGFISFAWIVYDFLKNYETANKFYLRGNKEFINKNFKNAIYFYNQAINEDPNNLYHLEGKARSHTKLGQYKEAEIIFTKIIDKDKDFIPAILNIGILYDIMGNHKKALIYYNLALEKNVKATSGMSWLKRFLKNIHFDPSNIKSRKFYLEKELTLPKEKQQLKNIELDIKQPDFQM